MTRRLAQSSYSMSVLARLLKAALPGRYAAEHEQPPAPMHLALRTHRCTQKLFKYVFINLC